MSSNTGQRAFHNARNKKAQKAGKEKFRNEKWLKQHLAFSGELWLGHRLTLTAGWPQIAEIFGERSTQILKIREFPFAK